MAGGEGEHNKVPRFEPETSRNAKQNTGLQEELRLSAVAFRLDGVLNSC